MPGPSPLYGHIACFVDRRHPEVIDAVLEVARRLRHTGAGALSIVHVAPPPPVLESGMSEWPSDPDDPLRPVEAWLDEVGGQVEGAGRIVLSGAPAAEAAAEWAAARGIDALVVGSASTPVQRAALGSFAAGLAARTAVPLVVVPHAYRLDAPPRDGQLAFDPDPPVRHVVCCVDDSPAASAALDEALRVREAFGARLTLVRAALPPRLLRWRPVTRLLPAPAGPVRRARARLETLASHVPGAEHALVIGHPRLVCEWARVHGADLVIAGTHGDEPGPRLPGGFARQLALHAASPVMLVPPALRSGVGDAGA